jgi:hypothetical protein
MSDPISGQIDPTESSVSVAIRDIARSAILREQARAGVTKDTAARSIARRIREAPGTLINVAKERAKRVDSRLRDKLTAFAISQIEQEIARMTHELEVLRQCGADPRSDSIAEVENLLAKAKALMVARP